MWLTGTKGQIRFLGNSGLVLIPCLGAGHSWEGDNPETRERTVDQSRPRILAACTLGAENSDKLVVGLPACSGMRLLIYDPGESSQNEDSRTHF